MSFKCLYQVEVIMVFTVFRLLTDFEWEPARYAALIFQAYLTPASAYDFEKH
jgi:hypothetical protein